MSRLTFGIPFALSFLAAATAANAQLADVTWTESSTVTSNLVGDVASGVDPISPEPLSVSYDGDNYSMSGAVTFDPGPPNARCTVQADFSSGLTKMLGSSFCQIEFSFVVRQTSPPPVVLDSVLVEIRVQGSIDLSGDAEYTVSGVSAIGLSTDSGALDGWVLSANNAQGDHTDSFDETNQYFLAVDDVVDGIMTASAGINADVLASGIQAASTSWVDPIIEIADATIPGSSANYRDHFEIEFAPGYWANGMVPARPATWGKIKRLYGN